ncbi:MAG TPA: hypothetical protein VG742_00750 [Dongiaceae bacterium]|nr:hypothetical protein [Dongiaceae bacterium]
MQHSIGSSRRQAPLMSRRRFARLALGGIGMVVTAPVLADQYVQSGTVRIEQVQIAFIGSGNLGGGILNYGGHQYDIEVGGLGVGGIGVSRMVATGIVYNLHDVRDFAGAYVQARYGLALGDLSSGELFLQNTKGVALRLKAERTGLALSLGGDAVYIGFG